MADEAVIGDRLQVAGSQQPASASDAAPHQSAAACDSPAQDSAERRVVQRINSQSTPQNPAGPSQAQPSGLALATAPVSNRTGVIVNPRPVSQVSLESDLLRTASRPESDCHEEQHRELRRHPIIQTPSRTRSFTPSEASSSLDASPTLAQDSSMSAESSQAERSRAGHLQRAGGLLGPVSWAARGAGRIVGSLLRRSSSSSRQQLAH